MRSRSSVTHGFLGRHGPLVQPRPVPVLHPMEEITNKRLALLASTAMIAVSLTNVGFPQGAPQTLSMIKVDPQSHQESPVVSGGNLELRHPLPR
jgi:hypothetical protein